MAWQLEKWKQFGLTLGNSGLGNGKQRQRPNSLAHRSHAVLRNLDCILKALGENFLFSDYKVMHDYKKEFGKYRRL